MTATRRLIYLSVLTLLVLAAALWQLQTWVDGARQEAIEAGQSAAATQKLIKQIKDLSHTPTVAEQRQVEQPQLVGRIEAAAREVPLPDRAVYRIDPEGSRRLADSDYEEHPVLVQIDSVTLEQLVRFLHKLSTDTTQTPQLHVRHIELDAPRGQDTGHTWQADVTLSYLVFNPRTTR